MNIDGTWTGKLAIGPAELRLVFHFDSSVGLTVLVDSPDQGVQGIPANTAQQEGDHLTFELASIRAGYAGLLSSDQTTIAGAWTQGTHSVPLVLVRAATDETTSTPRMIFRPQQPTLPLPYRNEDVFYSNWTAGHTLAATLSLPPGSGPHAAAVLISGSGPHDRDETIAEHKPFLVLSDYMARRGIAVLRADDRGIGKSTGIYSGVTTADLAADVAAGLTYLKTRPEIDASRVGLIGHSEGGLIASMIAARDTQVAFIVLLAAPGVRGDLLLNEQNKNLEVAMGTTREDAEAHAATRQMIFSTVREDDGASLEQHLRTQLLSAEHPAVNWVDDQVALLTSPWFRYFLSYDPEPALRKVSCPVLAVNGSLDIQVLSTQNLPAIKQALDAGGNEDATMAEFPGLNHLFQTASTGLPNEYLTLSETMSPVLLKAVTAWILERTSGMARHQSSPPRASAS